MLRIVFACLLGILISPAYAGLFDKSSNTEPLPVDQAFVMSVDHNAKGEVALSWYISPSYYLYKDKIKVEASGSQVESLMLPDPGERVELAGSEKLWRADVVFLALGFTGVEKGKMLDDLGVELTERNTIRVDENKQTTGPGVFAAGDCERGQLLVVWAIADGRRAASSVDRYLCERATT